MIMYLMQDFTRIHFFFKFNKLLFNQVCQITNKKYVRYLSMQNIINFSCGPKNTLQLTFHILPTKHVQCKTYILILKNMLKMIKFFI